jgi:hypothetical protein
MFKEESKKNQLKKTFKKDQSQPVLAFKTRDPDYESKNNTIKK